MAYRHLFETHLARQARRFAFVLWVPVGVHEHYRNTAQALVVGALQFRPQMAGVQRLQDCAVCADAFARLDDLRVEHFRQFDLQCEQIRPLLITDTQRIREPLRGYQQGRFAVTLQQCVGGDCGTHFHGIYRLSTHRRGIVRPQCAPDSFHGGVGVAPRILGKQLTRDDAAIGLPRHHVGERTATINPELPAGFVL